MLEDVPVRQVRDVMTTALVTVDAEDGIDRLAELFEMHGFNVIPVVGGHGELAGLVTRRTLRRLHGSGGGPRAGVNLRVRDMMDTRTVEVEPSDPLTAVVDRMTRHRLRSIPIVRRSRRTRMLVGIVSRGDLLAGFADRPGPAKENSEEPLRC